MFSGNDIHLQRHMHVDVRFVRYHCIFLKLILKGYNDSRIHYQIMAIVSCFNIKIHFRETYIILALFLVFKE